MEPMTEAEKEAHVASYAIPDLLSDTDLMAVWREHWRAFETWTDAGLWFDRHREILAELVRRGVDR